MAASAQTLDEAVAVARAQARAMLERLQLQQRQCQSEVRYWQNCVEGADEEEDTAPYYEKLEELEAKLERTNRARSRLEMADGELSPALRRAENLVAQTPQARQFLRARVAEIQQYQDFKAENNGGAAASSYPPAQSSHVAGEVGRATGYKRAPRDARDWLWAKFYGEPPPDLPPRVNLESIVGPARDQGETSQCVCYALAALKHHDLWQDEARWAAFDPEPIYAQCKARDGAANEDGTTLRDAFKVAVKQGVCGDDGERYFVRAYARLDSVGEICHALSLGKVVMLGVQIAAALSQLGGAAVVAIEAAFVGGHCMLVTGYDALQQQLRVRNSWGAGWGDNGHCLLPYAYLAGDDGFEAWTSVDEHAEETEETRAPAVGPIIESGPPAREAFEGANFAWFAPEDVRLLGVDGPELERGTLPFEALDATFAVVARMRAFVDMSALKSLRQFSDARDELGRAVSASGERLFSEADLIDVFDRYFGSSAIYIDNDANGNFYVNNGRHRLYRAQQLGIKSVPVSLSNSARRLLMERIAETKS